MADTKPKAAEVAVPVVKEVVPVQKSIRDQLVAEGKRVFKETAKDVHQFTPIYPQVDQGESVNIRDRDNLYKKPLA